MNYLIRAIVAALVLGVCGASLATAQTQNGVSVPPETVEPTQRLCVVTGGVLSGRTGDTFKGVRVTLKGAGTTQVTYTDAHGWYRFTAPIGSYTLVFQAAGYASDRTTTTLEPAGGNDPGAICAFVGASLTPLRSSASTTTMQPPAPDIVHPLTESQYYSSLEAFKTTDASQSLSCQSMMQQANSINSIPQLRIPRMFTVLATEASLCLQAVRRETLDLLPTQIPRELLVAACRRSWAGDPTGFKGISGYCAASQFKPGTHLYDQ